MKDLKENIKKHNMKKLVLSAVLGMFCYYTNNAMNEGEEEEEKPEEEAAPIEIKSIDDVLMTMLEGQIKINKAKEEIEAYEKKIYFKINVEGKVKKWNVIAFIKQQYPTEEQNKKEVKDDIEFLEQYFHLEEKKDEYECTKDNLTEIFWEKTEEKVDVIIENEENKIKAYFKTIIDAEKAISKAFKTYYEAKKKAKKEAKKKEILKEIMKDCCGEEAVKNINAYFLLKLQALCKKKNLENTAGKTVIAIKKRINPSDTINEEDFINFLKQKIGIKEKKEEEKKEEEKKEEEKKEEEKKEEKKKQEGGCPCCDC